MSDDGLLALIRHGQSTDNELNLFSGWRDPDLTRQGLDEARAVGRKLASAHVVFDRAFVSTLRRAARTLALILDELGQHDVSLVRHAALNERDYGALSGLDKSQACSTFGTKQVHLWRKSYDAIPPGGESLAMTAARTIPLYETEILPRLRQGEHVLVVAHGNSLRSIVKSLDRLSDDDIERANIATGEILLYQVDTDGVASKRNPSF